MNGEDFRSKIREFKLRKKEMGQSKSETRVTIEEEKKMTNACSVRLYLEDHTVGNIVRMGLLKQKDITFAGYRQIHPLQHIIEIKLQTNGNTRPYVALQQTLSQLSGEFRSLEDEWCRKMAEKEKNMLKLEI